MPGGRNGVLVCAVVCDDENTEQGMEDMKEVAIDLTHTQFARKVVLLSNLADVVPAVRHLCYSNHS